VSLLPQFVAKVTANENSIREFFLFFFEVLAAKDKGIFFSLLLVRKI
jgi:hypothetical protein